MANRSSIWGMEAGQFTDFSPTTGDIVIDTISKRSGTYGLHVTAQSGVSTSVAFATRFPSGIGLSIFMRAYIWIVSLPSTARVIARGTTLTASAAASASSLELILNPTGTLSFGSNNKATIYATSASTLSPGQWYRIEIGFDFGNSLYGLRVNGAMEVDWLAGPTTSQYAALHWGAPDTVAAAFEYYLDDLAADLTDWPGYGRIERRNPIAVASDNANWAIGAGTGSKHDVLTEIPADGDTSYLLGPNNNTDEIVFQMDGVPAASVVPRAVQVWYYGKGHTGTASFQQQGRLYGANAYLFSSLTNALSFPSTGYNWRTLGFVQVTGQATPLSPSGVADQWNNEDADNIYIGLKMISTPSALRLSQLFLEIEYDDKASAVVDPYRQYMADFELALTSESSWKGNSGTGGSPTVSSIRAKWGTQSLRINPGSGGNGYWQVAPYNFLSSSTPRAQSLGFWLYVAARQTSGNIDLFGVHQNTTRGLYLVMNASGGIAYGTSTVTGSFSANNTIPTGQWVFIQIQFRQASAATTAANAVFKVWVDGTQIINETALTEGGVATALLRFGTVTSATGGCDLFYDGIIIDGSYSMPQRDNELKTIRPDSAGSFTSAGFTAVGTANKYDAIDDPAGVDDGDSTYVVSSGTAGNRESYGFETIPANTRRVMVVFYMVMMKRDGASNGSITHGPLVDGITSRITSTSQTNYLLFADILQRRPRRSKWDLNRVDTIEYEFVEASANKTRITRAAMVVEYSTLGEYGQRPSSYNQIVG